MLDSKLRYRFQIGPATVTLLIVDYILADYNTWMPAVRGRVPARFVADFEAPMWTPVQCVHIALPHASILIDAGRHEATMDSAAALPESLSYQDLEVALPGAGISLDEITHVVITHAHADHFNGLTSLHDAPLFPNARHYLGRADWEQAVMQQALASPISVESRTLGVIHNSGLLDLVDADFDVCPDIKILATPGETPGHLAVRLALGSEILYVVGDLYHHPVEVDHPDWTVSWVPTEPTLTSRNRIAAMVIVDNALLIATHIPGTGRRIETSDGFVWEMVKSVK